MGVPGSVATVVVEFDTVFPKTEFAIAATCASVKLFAVRFAKGFVFNNAVVVAAFAAVLFGVGVAGSGMLYQITYPIAASTINDNKINTALSMI